MLKAQQNDKSKKAVRKINVSKVIYNQYFNGSADDEIQSVVEQALKAWFDKNRPLTPQISE